VLGDRCLKNGADVGRVRKTHRPRVRDFVGGMVAIW
jgi:hypothetical protein